MRTPLAFLLAAVLLRCGSDEGNPGVRLDASPESGTLDAAAGADASASDDGSVDRDVFVPPDVATPTDEGGPPTDSPTDGGMPATDAAEAGPPGFPVYPVVSFPPENPPSDEKAVLGKILFWEEQLSSDDTVACGTCHRAGSGGADPRALEATSRHPGPDATLGTPDDIHGSQGVVRCEVADGGTAQKSDPVFGLERQVTRRKAPSYLDAMFSPSLFWDGRAATEFVDPDTGLAAIAAGGALESQAVGPPLSDAEMACEDRTWADIHQKLQTAVPLALAHDLPPDIATALAGGTNYPELFEAAFGTSEITTQRIAFAIATHERRLTSDQTPWDRWNAGETDAMTERQIRGFEVFNTTGRCNQCHQAPLFTDLGFHNLGFQDATFDTGRQEVTGLATDRGRFKTPTLRNAGLREAGGLLHDGSRHGATLGTVMNAYDFPPNADANTDPLMQILGLTDEERTALTDFVRNALTDPRVRDELSPFDRPRLGTEP